MFDVLEREGQILAGKMLPGDEAAIRLLPGADHQRGEEEPRSNYLIISLSQLTPTYCPSNHPGLSFHRGRLRHYRKFSARPEIT